MTKRRDGFPGEKLISLPASLLEKEIRRNLFTKSLFITHIGYFPRASFHHRVRQKGCKDNILIYCLSGSGWCYVNGKKYTATANQFFIIPATNDYIRYGASEEDPWTIYWVHFSGDNLEALNRHFSIDNFLVPQAIPFDEYKIQLWQQMYDCLNQGYSPENLDYANLCLYHFIACFLFSHKRAELAYKKPGDVADTAIEYMKKNISDRFTVSDLAARFNLSSSHFYSLFRAKTGHPPMDYFIQLKMQRACQLLELPNIKIKEVATRIGYDDPYYFSRIFTKTMGVSPQAYKNHPRDQQVALSASSTSRASALHSIEE